MKYRIHITKFLFLGLLLILLPKPAYAYLNPGTGSYLLQIIAAGIFTSLFFFKSFWYWVKKIFLKIIPGKVRKNFEKSE